MVAHFFKHLRRRGEPLRPACLHGRNASRDSIFLWPCADRTAALRYAWVRNVAAAASSSWIAMACCPPFAHVAGDSSFVTVWFFAALGLVAGWTVAAGPEVAPSGLYTSDLIVREHPQHDAAEFSAGASQPIIGLANGWASSQFAREPRPGPRPGPRRRCGYGCAIGKGCCSCSLLWHRRRVADEEAIDSREVT